MPERHLDEVYNVSPHLFIGAYWPRLNFKRMKKKGIVAIVNLMEDNLYDPRPLGFAYLYRGFPDETYPSHKYIDDIFDFIDDHIHRGGVLIHCAMGLSRSAGITIGYLMKQNPSWTWEQALDYVNESRSIYPALEIKESILDYFKSKDSYKQE
jgi:protein-tyrosine phosphatase